MAQNSVRESVSFDKLIASISTLSTEEKIQLWKVLDEQLAQIEEKMLEQSPTVLAEIREARADYEVGDYLSIDDYIAQQK